MLIALILLLDMYKKEANGLYFRNENVSFWEQIVTVDKKFLLYNNV